MTSNRLDQIRRSHANAQPNVVENPAWAHTHEDLTIALGEIDRLKALLLESKRNHYICDDCWYSCPASGECCNENSELCDCGADAWNTKVNEALARMEQQ